MKYLIIFMSAILFGSCYGTITNVGEVCRLPLEEGSWLVQYKETSGTCGELPDSIINFPAEVPNNCYWKRIVDPNSCSLTVESTCYSDGYIVESSLFFEQESYRLMSGYNDITLYYNNSFLCKSLYNITFTEL